MDDSDPIHEGTTQPLPPNPAPRKRPTELPKQIGRYRILRYLGEGAMGEVLLAFDPTLSRQIALKRIRPDRTGSEVLVRRFQTEAHVTALLQHPSVIPVYEYLDQGESGYYTMRPVEGVTLASLIQTLHAEPGRRAEWTAARLVRLFLQVCSAVAYAHSMGVLHRDIKPANIMLGPFEEIFILDWGMALLCAEQPSQPKQVLPERLQALAEQTASHALVGTPAYMAPELLQGSCAATPQTEVFALGVLLYELLAFRRPWTAKTVGELIAAMQQEPPRPPSILRRGRGISARLDAVVLRALATDPAARYPTVQRLAADVAEALEGRAPWVPVRAAADGESLWYLERGKSQEEADSISLRSRGKPFSFLFRQPLGDNVRLDLDVSFGRGTHQFWVVLGAPVASGPTGFEGYQLEILPGRRRTVRLRRSGRAVAGARNPRIPAKRWHRISVTREDDRLSLSINGSEIYTYRDPIPLRGTRLTLQGVSTGLDLRNPRVHRRGSDLRVSCLAVPDALYNREHYEEAMAEYATIASAHPGRPEAIQARFRSALCAVEMQHREADAEVGELWLGQAEMSLGKAGAAESSCLLPLGKAIVARARRDSARAHDALVSALTDLPDDPDLPTIREWILGQLHSASEDDRGWVAELLPLAIRHCMGGHGRHAVRELVHTVRNQWEMPSFIVGRAQFQQGSETSHAESILFLAFWAGRASLIEQTAVELVRSGHLRAYHVSDFIFSLLELDALERAERLLEVLDQPAAADGGSEHYARAAQAATLAVSGDLERATAALAAMKADPFDRAFNGARLWLARSGWKHGDKKHAPRYLKPLDDRDYFAMEHRAWFFLANGDPRRSRRELEPLIDRGDHLKGRNLVNLLYGAYLLATRRPGEAERTFRRLRPTPWPRTWTLGSHYASGQLGEGSLDRYLEGCFDWERAVLEEHRSLLSRVAGS
ncbi:hypothetical protein ABI59_12065 [Acidobacteria bacterium Mor1]|nr:hypothetical protein ABI59_12065 [Acidobacteria bacterium Mor1]